MSLRFKLLPLAVLCIFLVSCETQNSVSESINNQLQSGATSIDLRGIATAFAWDKMYVFAPYSPKDDICKKVGLPPHECSTANLRDVDEGEFVLVFTHSKVITHLESFSRRIGNFDESERCAAVPIGIDRALFKVERKNGFLLSCE
jgi:hypothetical protein